MGISCSIYFSEGTCMYCTCMYVHVRSTYLLVRHDNLSGWASTHRQVTMHADGALETTPRSALTLTTGMYVNNINN